MKVSCVLVLALAVSMVSCQKPAVPAPVEEKKINTKEMWANIKDTFQKLKAKLSDPQNIVEAKGETEEQMTKAASTFNTVMVSIGNNIYKFSEKVKSQAEGLTVKTELAALGKCGEEVLIASAVPLSEVIGILAKKTVEKIEKIPDPPAQIPAELAKKVEEAATEAKKAAEKVQAEAAKTDGGKPTGTGSG